MRKLIISLLMGAMTLTGAAQQDTSTSKVNDLSFHCQIGGEDITFPCKWSDLERLGWSFSDAEDGDKMVFPTLNIILLDDREVSVISPQKKKAVMFFCNISDKEIPRKESMVLGMLYTSFESPITVYDFKLPSGITGGISTSENLTAIYGNPKNISHYDLYLQWRYSENISDDGFLVFIADDDTKVAEEGTIIGFGVTANKAVAKLISEANIEVSDEQAEALKMRRISEENIAAFTNSLQIAQADSTASSWAVPAMKYALAMNYYQIGQMHKAFELMLQAAEEGADDEGVDKAQFALGVMYSNGDGVEQDYQSAISWYEKAAQQGNAEAMNNLGNCYNNGQGVKENLPEAFKWWLIAAQEDYVPCYTLVADIYYQGIYDVKKNYKEAAYWYEKAAKTGDQTGIYNLSCMYHEGQGVERNYDMSFELLMQSDMNQYYTQQSLGEHYYYGHGVEKDIPRAINHFKRYLDLIESEDDETRKSLAKQMKAARKIISKTR